MSKLCLFCGKDINNENLWHRSCIKKMFNRSTIPHIEIKEDEIINENLEKGNTVPGVQKKFSLDSKTIKTRKTIPTTNYEYIVKTQQENLNNIVYNFLLNYFLYLHSIRHILRLPMFLLSEFFL